MRAELRFPRAVRPEDTLVGDLGVDGMDAVELLGAFAQTFRVDMTGFQIDEFFGPEMPFGIESLLIMFRELRGATPEEAAKLKPFKVSQLVDAAIQGKWPAKRCE